MIMLVIMLTIMVFTLAVATTTTRHDYHRHKTNYTTTASSGARRERLPQTTATQQHVSKCVKHDGKVGSARDKNKNKMFMAYCAN